uniref:Uncharacterized protein n=1 Tax=Anguilla anguilla TaxID=7936 RepID=A0A0E9PXE8_ANGAN
MKTLFYWNAMPLNVCCTGLITSNRSWGLMFLVFLPGICHVTGQRVYEKNDSEQHFNQAYLESPKFPVKINGHV